MRVATPSDPSRVRITAPFVAGCFFLLAGCGRVLGLDDYHPKGVQTEPDARAGKDAAPHADAARLEAPFDPKLPYLTGSVCETCVSEQCSDKQTDCSGDTDCTAWLADARAKPDPKSAFIRYLQFNTKLWDAAHLNDGGAVTVHEIALRNCARRCTSECELGRDFSCFGNFNWPQSFPTRTDIRFRFVDSQHPTDHGWSDFHVRACSDAVCTPSLGDAWSDAKGFVDLSITARTDTTLGQYPEFNGLMEVDGPGADGGLAFYPLVIESSRPWVSGYYGFQGHVPIAFMAPYFALLGKAYDPALAYYGVQPFDCREEPAKGVTVEMQVLDGTKFRPCDECSVFYSDDYSLPNASFTNFSTLGQIAYVSGPSRQSILVVRDVKTRRAVAAMPLFTLPGHYHDTYPFPPSAIDLTKFPPGVL